MMIKNHENTDYLIDTCYKSNTDNIGAIKLEIIEQFKPNVLIINYNVYVIDNNLYYLIAQLNAEFNKKSLRYTSAETDMQRAEVMMTNNPEVHYIVQKILKNHIKLSEVEKVLTGWYDNEGEGL